MIFSPRVNSGEEMSDKTGDIGSFLNNSAAQLTLKSEAFQTMMNETAAKKGRHLQGGPAFFAAGDGLVQLTCRERIQHYQEYDRHLAVTSPEDQLKSDLLRSSRPSPLCPE